MMLAAAGDPATGVLIMVASLACFVVWGVLTLLNMEGNLSDLKWSMPESRYCPLCKSRLAPKKGNCRRCGYEGGPQPPESWSTPPSARKAGVGHDSDMDLFASPQELARKPPPLPSISTPPPLPPSRDASPPRA
ncbi:hypothetical protein [Singulisphaera sp. PoT]|uniref:hypothetical protein n=1 Tax=Singulisphaera sp. PoT TaxID=3411797 RepID=UPI003BF58103